MYEGGADYGECWSTANRIKPHDVESWYHEWSTLAARIESIATTSLAKPSSSGASKKKIFT